MSTSPTPPASPVELLRLHRSRIRRLAQRLAGRDASGDADDVEQDVYVAALERPPRALVALPAWIGTTVRNLVSKRRRSKSRRDRREQSAATPEPQPSSSDLVARVELEEFTLRCVCELAEPDRTIVLLRFFEERSVAQIAQQLDLGESTVRAKLQRAIDRLRERLDAKSGDRDQWARALAPWLFLTKSAAPTATLTLAAAAVVVLVAGGVVTSIVGAGGRAKGSSQLPPIAAAIDASRDAPSSSSDPSRIEPTRTADAAVVDGVGKAQSTSATQPRPRRADAWLKIRPVDAVTRQPLAEASVRVADRCVCTSEFYGDTQHPEIRFAIRCFGRPKSEEGKWSLAVVAAGHDPDRREIVLEEGKTLDLGEVPLTRGSGAIEGHVRFGGDVDPSKLHVELRGSGRNRCPECWRHDEDGSCCGFHWDRSLLSVGANGRFEFRSLAAATYWLRVLDDQQRAVPTTRVELTRGEAKLVDVDYASGVALTLEFVDDVGRPFFGTWAKCADPTPELFHLEFDVDGVTLAADVGPDPTELGARIGPAPPFDSPPNAESNSDLKDTVVIHDPSGTSEAYVKSSGRPEIHRWFNDGGRTEVPFGGVDDVLFQNEHKVPGFAVVELASRRLDANHWLFHDLPASRVKVHGSCGSLEADGLDLDLSKSEQRHARLVFRARASASR